MKHPIPHAVRALAFLLPTLAACSGSSSSPDLFGGLPGVSSRATPHAVAPDAPLAIGKDWLAYLADEATSGGSDLNEDGDTLDRVAVAFDLKRLSATPLRAARGVWLLADELYLTTREDEDGNDWNADGLQDAFVLLHRSAPASVTFVAALEDAAPVGVGERLYFSDASDTLPPTPGATKLHFLSASQPELPGRVLAAGTVFGVEPGPRAQDGGLLFLLQDEQAELRDLNGDGDALDGRVLALLDGLDPAAPLRSVGRAVGADAPLRALRIFGDDWLVSFLVDEAAQGGTNLNDSASFAGGLQPASCAGREDADADDLVLHCLFHHWWSQDPVLIPPLNTGLVGEKRVFALEDLNGPRHVVGTLASESAEGTCSLNGDADQDDQVLLWVEVAPDMVLSRPRPSRHVALFDASGGAHGAVELEHFFVAALSESGDEHDYDGDPANAVNMLSRINPFTRQGAPEDWGPSSGLRIVSSMTVNPDRRFLAFAAAENPGVSCNGDADFADSFAMFGRIETTGMTWRGWCHATEPFNAGLVLVGDVAFVRVDEAEDERDFNEDGDRLDQVLIRHTIFPLGGPRYVATLNALPIPAVIRGAGDTVAFLQEEAQSGRDANGDGDATDFVLRTVPVR